MVMLHFRCILASLRRPVCPSVGWFVQPSLHLSVSQSVCLSICPSHRLSSNIFHVGTKISLEKNSMALVSSCLSQRDWPWKSMLCSIKAKENRFWPTDWLGMNCLVLKNVQVRPYTWNWQMDWLNDRSVALTRLEILWMCHWSYHIWLEE